MKHLKPIILLFCSLALCAAHAQEKTVLTFNEYLSRVKSSNIDFLAQQYAVDIAVANQKAARVFPDPELSVSYANNQNWNLQMGYGIDAELSFTLELGGKRKARMRLARSEKEMTEALLEDFFRNLRADATIAYLAAIKQHKVHEIQKASYARMLELARADSLRFRLGLITEIDARQSKLEAATMLNDVCASEGDCREALMQLLLFQGSRGVALPDSVAGTLQCAKRNLALATLIVAAQNNRADLQAALKSKEVSQNNLRLARANRVIDLGLSLGAGYSSVVKNEIAPAPDFFGITGGVSIPLKFSNANKGELQAAKLAAAQSEKQYEAAELQIRSEVMLAYSKYTLACSKVERFNDGLLHEADIILEKKIYSYERGETGILEVLNAQRTYNDVQLDYNEALYECAEAWVELERACGMPEVSAL